MRRIPTFFGALLLCGLCVGLAYFMTAIGGNRPASSVAPLTPAPVATATLVVGAQVRLRNEGPVYLAISKPTLDTFIKAAASNDQATIRALISSGAVFTVADNTPAQVVQIDYGALDRSYQVRVGAQSGWVPETTLERQ